VGLQNLEVVHQATHFQTIAPESVWGLPEDSIATTVSQKTESQTDLDRRFVSSIPLSFLFHLLLYLLLGRKHKKTTLKMVERAEDAKEIESMISSESTLVKNIDGNRTMSAEVQPAVSSTISKNEPKRKRTSEKVMEIKRRRKEQQKKIKIARAEGRDISSGWERRNTWWQESFRKHSRIYQNVL